MPRNWIFKPHNPQSTNKFAGLQNMLSSRWTFMMAYFDPNEKWSPPRYIICQELSSIKKTMTSKHLKIKKLQISLRCKFNFYYKDETSICKVFVYLSGNFVCICNIFLRVSSFTQKISHSIY